MSITPGRVERSLTPRCLVSAMLVFKNTRVFLVSHKINVKKENAVEAVRKYTNDLGVDYVLECSGASSALNDAAKMVNRGGKICLAAFPGEEVPVDVAHLVRNNIYVYGIRGEGKSGTHRACAFMEQKRFDASLIHTHTFNMDNLPEAIRYAKDRVEDAIKVVVKNEF